MATHFDAVFSLVTASSDDPLVGVGHATEDIELADLPTDCRGNGVGERIGKRTEAAPGLRQQVEQAQLGEDIVVPRRRRPDEARKTPNAVGEAACLSVDESSSEVVPRGESGQCWVGEACPDSIFEPPVEFGESRVHSFHAFVSRVVAIVVGNGRRHGLVDRVPIWSR